MAWPAHLSGTSPQALQSRILRKVSVAASGCWEWTYRRNANGNHRYPRTTFAGRLRQASHIAYEAFIGPIPAGMIVCHRCDNTGCVNPDHLFLGDHTANMRDALVKGRKYWKLTAEQAAEIKRRYESRSATARQLAREYGVNRKTIGFVVNGRRSVAERPDDVRRR